MPPARQDSRKHPSGRPTVCVFGGSGDVYRDGPVLELAEAAGRRLAELGYRVASGGYGGTMEACSRGAKSAGGGTIGVTCSIWRSSANPYIDEVITTASLAERLTKLIEIGDGGYVVLGGATGTLAELACVWEWKCKGVLGDRPLVCLGRFWQPVISLMTSIRPASAPAVATAEEVEDLVKYFPTVGAA